jgi:outer membrane protein insertion porin family
VTVVTGRPYDPSEARRSLAAIDSLYKKRGYYFATGKLVELPQSDGTIRLVFDINEGRRVAISQIVIEGNKRFSAGDAVKAMKTKPEGFWWWRKGAYNEEQIERDLRERLPAFYGEHGHPDFEVLRDTLVVDEKNGKGTLIVSLDEGPEYQVGEFEVAGNRRFSTEQLRQFFPFSSRTCGFLGLVCRKKETSTFDQKLWDDATGQVRTSYYNNGYIYATVNPVLRRRTASDGTHRADLRWQIQEGQPAIVNRVLITGNTVTHEDVIRRAIIVVPGDLFRQDALIRSYQAVSNLGFFNQPLPVPDTRPVNDQGDVDVIFKVEEKRTGAVNFGASLGQGTGLGGFIGLQEPNLFGRGKRVSFQWQFGKNINDFQVSYTDPAISGSLVSGTLILHDSRLRYTIADLGQIRTRGGTLQAGIPVFGSRYTRLFTSYTLEASKYDAPSLVTRFRCQNCVLSALGTTIQRDTRIGLPFATGGSLQSFELSQNGGILQGSGDFRRANVEGRWYAPLAQLGGGPLGGGLQFLIGFTTKSGFVWGDPGPHFRQLFAMGGTQYGIPLRGYDEFSITPKGFDPRASSTTASANAFGESYFTGTAEIGMRISQMAYVSTFFEGGNVWASPREYNPTRLFRGAGVGVSVLSPLGPLGIDLARGFDRTDVFGNRQPGWKVHFRLGQYF